MDEMEVRHGSVVGIAHAGETGVGGEVGQTGADFGGWHVVVEAVILPVVLGPAAAHHPVVGDQGGGPVLRHMAGGAAVGLEKGLHAGAGRFHGFDENKTMGMGNQHLPSFTRGRR